MVMKAYYQLPNNSSYYTNPTIDFERKKRSPTRWTIYDMIESYLQKNKYGDGKACLLKSICELAAVPLEERSGLLAEIVHSILTPSSTDDEIEQHAHNAYHAAEKLGKDGENCEYLFPECPVGPIQQFSRFMNINKYMY
ncbi:uncharacterized protein LOC115879765 [Sitophilus oryzae]|uniref:Uncharacterized protein LOC115879765 n=1 Tax=Sitophilus oryzae TaxID=7048 RepID=A0A6J2XM55_SITOR|nr:uncharacterized protein LOC115879765 [Sitophilus oryzae]XP_030752613.1 uncharacterized protein LOC115879765 [Sitophilus oryzae]